MPPQPMPSYQPPSNYQPSSIYQPPPNNCQPMPGYSQQPQYQLLPRDMINNGYADPMPPLLQHSHHESRSFPAAVVNPPSQGRMAPPHRRPIPTPTPQDDFIGSLPPTTQPQAPNSPSRQSRPDLLPSSLPPLLDRPRPEECKPVPVPVAKKLKLPKKRQLPHPAPMAPNYTSTPPSQSRI
ncbi:hypothetical protein K432DRAFT_399816 [Lepidopterella palustris CBS 459.81]|uniref:Uncharacterized protein n=1 Tax=Lepidopterella palustris CBS 459.81 TaxID=1314670 RepID=A0A8E2JL27_9PEZI|nr:hypothetical protein K432DRAFT_399816 [Lepidopterella palustris CBS 459.81]